MLVRDNGDCTGGHLVEPSYLLLDKTSEGEHITFKCTNSDQIANFVIYVDLVKIKLMISPNIPLPSLVSGAFYNLLLIKQVNDIIEIADWSKVRKPGGKNE